MADTNKEFKIWIPRKQDAYYSIEVDSVDVTNDVIEAEFTNGIFGIDSICKIKLIDPNGTYASTYTGGETVEFKLDFTDGSTSKWKGTLERPKKQFGDMYSLELIGSNYQSDALDITVTESYDDMSPDAILKDLITNYLSSYTSTNVESSSKNITIKWNNKPFYDCIIDLCEIAGFDCYVDTDKDFHFFEQESITNSSDAIIWNDTLVSIENFGTDNVDVKNRIIVYGEDETGLPIVYQTDDTNSQTTYGVKEKVVKDSSIRTYAQAKDYGDGLLDQEKEKANKGKIECLLLPYINPGDMIWITHPVLNINDTYRIIQYTYKLHSQRTTVVISKTSTIPTLFKERRKAELAGENITNPYKMKGSLNLSFDNNDEYDDGASSGIEIQDSKLKLQSGIGTGIMVSNRQTAESTINSVHLKVIGDTLAGASFKVSANDGGNYDNVELEKETSISSSGKKLRVKATITDSDTRIDSICCMYK